MLVRKCRLKCSFSSPVRPASVELAARSRVPLRARQFQVAQAVEPAQPLQIRRLDQRADQVDSPDAPIARGQAAQIRDRVEAPFEGQTAALTDDPFGDGAVRRLGRGQQPGHPQDAE